MRGNFLSIPTDCPQRDERLGWTGDINVFAPTANFLYDTAGMLQGWLRDVAEEQLRDHGNCPPFFCPDVPVDDVRYPTAIWGDVAVGLPWSLYNSYGDEEILKRQLESMQTWVNEGIPRDAATGLWAEDSYQFGDWLDPLAPPDDPGNSVTDPLLVANAHLVQTTTLMHKISAAIGREEQAASYREAASKLKRAFQRRYVSADGRVVADSQTALALAIHLDLFDSPEQEKTAAARLKHLIRRNSRFKIATGFAGTPVLGHALSRAGESQLFYRMLYHRKAPSWLYQVTMGATTMWERWDSKLPDGSINPGEMTSFNHYALGAVADWMHRVIAGLSVLEPGWKKFRVAPVPGGDLTHAEAKFLSPYGRIVVKWMLEDEAGATWFTLSVRVPPNTSAEVVVPRGGDDEARDEMRVVLPGLHEFRVEYRRPTWPPLPLYPQFYPHDDDEP
jgi:alpha-L-rhamnosidase